MQEANRASLVPAAVVADHLPSKKTSFLTTKTYYYNCPQAVLLMSPVAVVAVDVQK